MIEVLLYKRVGYPACTVVTCALNQRFKWERREHVRLSAQDGHAHSATTQRPELYITAQGSLITDEYCRVYPLTGVIH